MSTTEGYCGVFQGGGVKCIALVGGLRRLDRANIRFTRVIGTSGGAIVAALYAAGYSTRELRDMLWAQDFGKLLDPAPFLLWGLVTRFGVHRGVKLHDWVYKMLAERNVRTFADLTTCDLMVVASDITERKLLTFSKTTHPTMSIAEAVRMSAGIPLFFYPYRLGQKMVVDGGVLSNFPIWATEDERRNVIGLRLVQDQGVIAPRPPSNLKSFLWALANTMMGAHDKRQVDAGRYSIIDIPTFGIPATKFALTGDEKKALYRSGIKSAQDFLPSYSPAARRSPRERVIAERDAVSFACKRLQGGGARDLQLWGYAMSWAEDIRRTLNDTPAPDLRVKIFWPEVAALDRFDDESKQSNVDKRGGNLANWRTLVTRHSIASVELFESVAAPNGMGFLIDDEALYFGTYGFHAPDGRLAILKNPIAQRRGLLYLAGTEEDELAIRCYSRQLLCRTHDAVRCQT